MILSVPGLVDVVVIVWKEDGRLQITADVTDELETVNDAFGSEFVLPAVAVEDHLCSCCACAREARGHEEHTLSLTKKKRGLTSNRLGSKLLESTLRACHDNQTTLYFGQVTSIVER
jgi:hypothetical protein